MADSVRSSGLGQFLQGRVYEAKLSVTGLQDFDLCSDDRNITLL
jgi:hypothetical protein